MGMFGSIFGPKNKRSSVARREADELFEKIAQLLGDENLQNAVNHPMIKEKIVGGLDVDQLPDGIGEFGRSAENPIPVNGPLGELVYLSLLKTRIANQRLLFHRLGSVESLDIYETVSIDGGKWDILFFSMYHPRKSRKSPAGYALAEPRSQPLLYGTNRRVEGFPYGLQAAIRQTTEEMIGIPLPPPQVRQAEESVRFQRPREHEERITIATAHVQGFRS
jgi:hypothetical protein